MRCDIGCFLLRKIEKMGDIKAVSLHHPIVTYPLCVYGFGKVAVVLSRSILAADFG
jgi:hypothetical protein